MNIDATGNPEAVFRLGLAAPGGVSGAHNDPTAATLGGGGHSRCHRLENTKHLAILSSMITDSEPEALDKVALTTTLYKNIVTASKVRPNPENLVPEMWPEIANQGCRVYGVGCRV